MITLKLFFKFITITIDIDIHCFAWKMKIWYYIIRYSHEIDDS